MLPFYVHERSLVWRKDHQLLEYSEYKDWPIMVFSNWDPLSELCTLSIFFSNLLHFLQHFLFNAQQCVSNLFENCNGLLLQKWCLSTPQATYLHKTDLCNARKNYAEKINCLLLIPWHLQNWYFKRKNINYDTEFCYLINLRYCGIWILQRIWTWELVELAPWSAWTFNLNVWKWFFI